MGVRQGIGYLILGLPLLSGVPSRTWTSRVSPRLFNLLYVVGHTLGIFYISMFKSNIEGKFTRDVFTLLTSVYCTWGRYSTILFHGPNSPREVI